MDERKVKLFTSYYSSPWLKETPLRKVAISRGVPKWFKPDAVYLPLAPSWKLVHINDEAEYKRRYKIEVLDRLSAMKIVETFRDGAIFLCWEPAGKFCHRQLVAEWIESTTGIVVPELSLTLLKIPKKEEPPADLQGRLDFGE